MARGVLAFTVGLALAGCAGGAARGRPPHAPPPLPAAGSAYGVIDALGHTFVIVGAAATAPVHRGKPRIVGHGKMMEIADSEVIETPPEFTVVDTTGACVTTAGHSVKLGGSGGWRDAYQLDGCRGDPAHERLALAGAIADARWVAPAQELTADGKAIPTSEFYQPTANQLMEWRARLPGLSVTFERSWRGDGRDEAATRVVENGRVLASYRAALEGAIHAGQRWLFVFRAPDGRSVLELRADALVPILGSEPPTAPLDEIAKPDATQAASVDPAQLGGSVRVRAAPAPGRNQQATITKIGRQGERATLELQIAGASRQLELELPAAVPLPVAAGDAVSLDVSGRGGGPNRRHHVLVTTRDGKLLFEIGSGASKAKGWTVERGEERLKQRDGDRTRHDYRARFEHAGQRVAVEPGSFARLDAGGASYFVWGTATSVDLPEGRPVPPDFVKSWLDFAVFLAK